jgi:hypothetical protein
MIQHHAKITTIIKEVGYAISGTIGIAKAWTVYTDHFLHETWIRVIDAVIVGAVAAIPGTILTLIITYLWKRYIK